jgi:hypothetical protein
VRLIELDPIISIVGKIVPRERVGGDCTIFTINPNAIITTRVVDYRIVRFHEKDTKNLIPGANVLRDGVSGESIVLAINPNAIITTRVVAHRVVRINKFDPFSVFGAIVLRDGVIAALLQQNAPGIVICVIRRYIGALNLLPKQPIITQIHRAIDHVDVRAIVEIDSITRRISSRHIAI